MARNFAKPEPSAGRSRRSAVRAGAVVPALALAVTLALPVLAVAQDQGTGNRHFTAAPTAKLAEEDSDDSIKAAIGISTNALFLTVVGVIGVFWFTVGGGRRAKKLGRQE